MEQSAWGVMLLCGRLLWFSSLSRIYHDDVIKWKHFPRYWPFVRGIHRSTVNSPHKGQWRGALMFSLICARIDGWVNNDEAGDLRRHRAHCDVIVMSNSHSHRYMTPFIQCGLCRSFSIKRMTVATPTKKASYIGNDRLREFPSRRYL